MHFKNNLHRREYIPFPGPPAEKDPPPPISAYSKVSFTITTH